MTQKIGNTFSKELIAQSQQYLLSKNPDAALLATILNVPATANTEQLIEICENIAKL